MTTIDGTDVADVTIDGTQVQEITMDGSVVWTANAWIDTFEDNDIAEYSWDTGDFATTTNGTPPEGSYALTNSTDGSVKNISSFSGDGLDNYVDQGDTFQWAWKASSTSNAARPSFGYGVDTTSYDAEQGSYHVSAYPDNGEVRLVEWSGGTGTEVGDVLISYTAGNWWSCKVTWNTDDTHDIYVYEGPDPATATLHASTTGIADSTHSGNNGTASWLNYCASGEKVYMDAAEVI